MSISQKTLSVITDGVLDAVLNANNTEDQSQSNLEILADTFKRLGGCNNANVRLSIIISRSCVLKITESIILVLIRLCSS